MAVLVNVLAVIVAVCALGGFPHAIVMLRCLLRFGVSWLPRVSGFSFEYHREVDSWVRGAEACAGCTAVSVFTRILLVFFWSCAVPGAKLGLQGLGFVHVVEDFWGDCGWVWSAQDFVVPLSAVTGMWRQGKITLETCRSDIIQCREVGVQRMMNFLEWYESHNTRALHDRLTASILTMEEAECRPFMHHELIDTWLMQYHGRDRQARFRTLLLRGITRSGKTQKACSIYGFARTLVVNAQGLENNLPSLSHLDRRKMDALVLDEGTRQQVLHNKQFFQAGARAVQLGQSRCNQFSYSVFVYKLPLIITSNYFPMTVAEGLSQEDADWLQANIIDVPVPVGGKWWIEDGLDEIDVA